MIQLHLIAVVTGSLQRATCTRHSMKTRKLELIQTIQASNLVQLLRQQREVEPNDSSLYCISCMHLSSKRFQPNRIIFQHVKLSFSLLKVLPLGVIRGIKSSYANLRSANNLVRSKLILDIRIMRRTYGEEQQKFIIDLITKWSRPAKI